MINNKHIVKLLESYTSGQRKVLNFIIQYADGDTISQLC